MTPTLILTRPLAQSERFGADVMAAWDGPLRLIISPLLTIVPVPAAVPDVDAVIFTSANGVEAARRIGLGGPSITAWCVGARTAEAAEQVGFQTITGPGDAAGLIDHIVSAQPSGTFAHIHGKHARGDVAARLTAAGIACRDVIAYDQQACALSKQAHAALCGDKPVIFPLFSPRTCTILSEQGPFGAPVRAIALSDAVKDALDPALGWDVSVARSADGTAMQDAVLAELMRHDAIRGSLEGPA